MSEITVPHPTILVHDRHICIDCRRPGHALSRKVTPRSSQRRVQRLIWKRQNPEQVRLSGNYGVGTDTKRSVRAAQYFWNAPRLCTFHLMMNRAPLGAAEAVGRILEHTWGNLHSIEIEPDH